MCNSQKEILTFDFMALSSGVGMLSGLMAVSEDLGLISLLYTTNQTRQIASLGREMRGVQRSARYLAHLSTSAIALMAAWKGADATSRTPKPRWGAFLAYTPVAHQIRKDATVGVLPHQRNPQK
jgi:hypothetical protein